MKFSYTKNTVSDFFYKETKSKKNLVVGRGWGGGVARVSHFFSFFKRIQVWKKCFFFEGVKVREDWLVG